MKLKSLKLNENNPRTIKDESFEKLKQSIADFPKMMELRPIVYDPSTMVILGGNMRFKALKDLGYKEIPETWIKGANELTEEEKRRFIVEDNVSFGDWNIEQLKADYSIEELNSWGLDGFNFEYDIPIDDNKLNSNIDTLPENSTDIFIKENDLIEIGKHKILCSDSQNTDVVKNFLNGVVIDLVFTDPPYGISIVNNNGNIGASKIAKVKTYNKIKNDNNTNAAKNFYEICNKLNIKNYIIFGGNYFTDFLPVSSAWIVWDKKNGENNFADVELAWTSYNKASRIYPYIWNGMIREGSTVLEGKSRIHPTQKPAGLIINILKDYEFTTCFDGFLGSGSTMVALNELNKTCYAMEIEPYYCQLSVARLLTIESNLTVKVNGIDVDRDLFLKSK